MRRCILSYFVGAFLLSSTLGAQQSDQETIAQLVHRLVESEKRLAESERRIQALEQRLGMASTAVAAPSVSEAPAAAPDAAGLQTAAKSAQAEADAAAHAAMPGHNMDLPHGGPTLNIRGFFDFNFGAGSIANPLIFPVASNGCQTCGNPVTPAHSEFQAGEFDLFMTSKLSEHLSFLSEMVVSAGTTNQFDVELERYQLTYRYNDYFSASAGRFHTSIGYYNTAYHHGNWFSTAEGRPIMYLFEDSGGVLPVHMVGVTATGLVPKTGGLGLHWVAEMGNGRSSNTAAEEPAQNFYSDRNYKAFNLAAYVRPDWLQGLQIGGSYYHDKLAPAGLAHVNQNIASGYVVYNTAKWEFMNEAVMLSNHLVGTNLLYRSPMAYTQLSRAFGIYRPYFRYQYVNDRPGDPVNILHGSYYGPSVGIRIDYSDYAAFKLQYNRLFSTQLPAANGLNAQLAFTF
jgi:hypothetical protein